MIHPAYLAGVWDSDGSITITKRHIRRPNPNYTIMVQLTWVETPSSMQFMEMLVNQFGGSFFQGDSSSSFIFHTKKIVKYCATGKAAIKLLEFCMEYLLLKKIQAENCMKLAKMLNTTKPGVIRSIEMNHAMADLYEFNKSINSKNSHRKIL